MEMDYEKDCFGNVLHVRLLLRLAENESTRYEWFFVFEGLVVIVALLLLPFIAIRSFMDIGKKVKSLNALNNIDLISKECVAKKKNEETFTNC